MTVQATTPHPPGATHHLGGEAWCSPSLEPLLVPIGEVSPFPGNPRRHDQDNITGSVRDLGCWAGIVAQTSTGHVLVGNGRRQALADLGATLIPVTFMDVDDTRAAAIVARDNQTSDASTNDEAALLELLTGLGDALPLSGYDDDYMAGLLSATDDAAGGVPDEETSTRALTPGEALSVADVTWGDPHHRVHHGEVWTVGRHTLVVARLHAEHALWRHLLTDEHLFAPYPEPYLTTGTEARERPLLLIQPNPYLAGHLLDKHASVFPEDRIAKQDAP